MTDVGVDTPYRNINGELGWVRFVPGKGIDPTGKVPIREVATDHAGPLLQKWVPELDGRADPTMFDRLDAEIRALFRLTQSYGTRYPRELPRLVGYNVDVVEPFLLVEPFRGRPVEGVLHTLGTEDVRELRVGLLRALGRVHDAHVVHGGVSLSALHWDGTSTQLVGFEQAVAFPSGRGEAAHPGDDVLAAGQTIRLLELGPDAGDPSGDPPGLRNVMTDVFLPDRDARPTVIDLLGRFRARPEGGVTASRPDARYDRGRDRYDQASAAKRARRVPEPVEPQASSSSSRSGAVILLVAAVLLVAIVLLAVALGQGR